MTAFKEERMHSLRAENQENVKNGEASENIANGEEYVER